MSLWDATVSQLELELFRNLSNSDVLLESVIAMFVAPAVLGDHAWSRHEW